MFLMVCIFFKDVMPVNQLTVKKEVNSRMKKNGTTSGPLTKKITTTSDDHYHSNEKNSFNPYLDKYQHNKVKPFSCHPIFLL